MTFNRAQWLEERRSYIGGSDVAAILGLSKWRTALEVYKEKVGEFPLDAEATVRQKAGMRMQQPILEDYCENEGVRLLAVESDQGERNPALSLRHPDLPFLGANLDAVVANEFGDVWNVDAKNIHWRVADEWGEVSSDQMPDDAFYQGHLQNFLSPPAIHKTDFAVLVGGEWPVKVFSVPRDDEFFALLVDDLAKFWWHVENRVPVPPDFAHKTTVELMQRLYPDVDPNRKVILDAKVHALAERYYALGRIGDYAKKRRDLLKGELLFLMGDAAVAEIDDSPFYLRRSHLNPRRCKKCGHASNEEGSTKFEIKLTKEKKDHVPVLEAAAQKLIEGETA